MLKQIILSASAVALAASCATAQQPEASIPGWLTKDYAEFVEMFEGQWDSDRHVFFAKDAGLDPAQIAPRQHIEITRAVLSSEEDDATKAVFKAIRTVEGGDPATLIHTLKIEPATQSIRQTIAAPGGVLQPTVLDCHIDWHRSGAQFQGAASGADCASIFTRPADGGALEVSLVHSETEFWITTTRGENKIEARLRRARPFECWTAILRGASHGDSGENMNDWDFLRGVKLHDQGGEAELITDEDEPRRIRLRLRNVDWPYGTSRPSLTLYVLEGDSDRAVSYAWNEGNAERIGLNLRWLQASCTHTPAEGD